MDDIEHEPRARPDIDNVRKSVQDALKGIAYSDDRDVVSGETRHCFIDHDKMPCTRIIITEKHWTDYRERSK